MLTTQSNRSVEIIRKKVVSLSLVLVVLTVLAAPATAWSDSESYEADGDPVQTFGNWDAENEQASESLVGLVYRCQIMFEYTGIDTSADVYKIQIDYDGVSPGVYPYWESLGLYYRWGDDGSWIHKSNLDIYTYDGFLTITDATSSTCQILFIDQVRTFDLCPNTWYFGNEPIVWAYWN
jgi:hypothetical protein